MLDFKINRNQQTGEAVLETSISGKNLLTTPQLNKGTAFTLDERLAFGLMGKLPHRVETLSEQVDRAYAQYQNYPSLIEKHIYLNNLHDKNQILFYRLIQTHLTEMLPIIYTPVIGKAVQQFSHIYRQSRGLYISYPDLAYLDQIIQNRSNPEIDLIVMTDGEGVLGIGDQGIGGMCIPVGKLMVYSLCGGINPNRTLPIFLDVGTNNTELLNEPMYLGLRQPRIPRAEYDHFIHSVMQCLQTHFPKAFIQWEDFGRDNARRMLDYYQDKCCTFNDDIQGTGAVTLAALLAACQRSQTPLTAQRILIFGAGSAGTGIADQILDAMLKQGINTTAALAQFWLVDRQGLLTVDDANLTDAQRPYARAAEKYPTTLLGLIEHIKPTALIGCSAQAGAFTRECVESMSRYCQQPIIFPLSNPDEKCEANPTDLLQWSQGRALIATGTSFPDVTYQNQPVIIAQCNNALVFPGIGLGVLAVRASRLSKHMIWAASTALSQFSEAQLLPSIGDAAAVAQHIAIAVAAAAIEEGLAELLPQKPLDALIDELFWTPHYLPFKRST